MKYAVLFFGVMFNLVQGEVREDIDAIARANLDLVSPYLDELADEALLDSNKTMDKGDLTSWFKAPAPEFSKKISEYYESAYTPSEISRIRELHEDDTFLKLQLHNMKSQNLSDVIHDTMMEIIEENGEPKEAPKLQSLVRIVPVEFFDLFVEMSRGYLILDVYADWCAPCQRLKPVLDALSVEYTGIRFMQLNSDDAKEICKKYKVKSLPTLIFFKDGKEIGRSKGYMNLESGKVKINEIFGL